MNGELAHSASIKPTVHKANLSRVQGEQYLEVVSSSYVIDRQ